MTDEQRLANKRAGMARRRAANPEAERERQRQWLDRHKDRLNEERRQDTARRLFWSRALRLRGITANDLWRLWKRQRGLCALTGQKLDRLAEIDHRHPKVRGGTDEIANLQWVTREASRAKRDMTEAEFLALCRNCARWIGRRIELVEDVARTVGGGV